MPEDVRVINARRSYEMPMDGLRLSVVCTDPVMGMIRETYGFQISQVGTPIQTVGPVQPTVPPGAVFNLGSFIDPEGQVIPIRFLHFEPRRVVIDVAGPSEAIDAIWAHLIGMLGGVATADGIAILADPINTIEASEISARLDLSPESMLAPGFASTAQTYGLDIQTAAAAAILQPVPDGEEFQGMGPGQYGLQVRAGTKAGDHVFYSGAPLPSGRHLGYLVHLESALKKPSRTASAR